MRVREANARILRANFRLKTDAMFIGLQLALPCIKGTPDSRRIELCAGRGRKENVAAAQGGTRFPNRRPTENASQNIGSDWDVVSG